jgi:hypothetical protein
MLLEHAAVPAGDVQQQHMHLQHVLLPALLAAAADQPQQLLLLCYSEYLTLQQH